VTTTEPADASPHTQPGWWADRVGYQVYLPSFADGDGDGWGDLTGLRQRLDHLAWLGVDLVWLSPINPSPMADHGYDVADYCAVHPRLGTLADVDALLAEARDRGIAVLLDLVPNHTSVEHPWFQRARASRDDPYRDYYHWGDPAPDGGPPNNWVSVFGGPAWTFEPATGQYYLHLYAPEQPDLNWDNPAVAREFDAILRFWLDRGVAGFRIDVAHALKKAPGLPDQPEVPAAQQPARLDGRAADHYAIEHVHDREQPGLRDLHRRWRAVAEPYGALLLGEVYILDPQRLATYLRDQDGLHTGFWFGLVESEWDPAHLAAQLRAAEVTGPHLAWVQSSHDRRRAPTRYGGGQMGRRRALTLAVLTLGLPALPVLYQGDELGLEDGHVPPQAYQDPLARRTGGALSRDPARTPMPWEPGERLGFTDAEQAWLPWGGRTDADTVAVQRADPGSPLWAYRRLVALRGALSGLRGGPVRWHATTPPVVAYVRGDVLVAGNLEAHAATLALPEGRWTVRLRTQGSGAVEPDDVVEGALSLPGEHAAILQREVAAGEG